MSMLSAQCAELRDKAKLLRGHADGLTAPYVIPSTKELMMLTMLDSATRMEEAADTIISLRDRLQNIELGRGTCVPHGEWERLTQTTEFRRMYCDCGYELGIDSRDSFPFERTTYAEMPRFCPECGARIMSKAKVVER